MKHTALVFALIIICWIGEVRSCAFAQEQHVVTRGTEPAFIQKASITFPAEALGAGVVGKVWVKGLLGIDGIPVKTEIAKREPEMAFMFDDVARKWFMDCRFSAARDNTGAPVQVWVSIPVNFVLDGFEPPVCTQQAQPEYPVTARAMGIEGWVGVAVLVSDLGSALNGQAIVVAREPPYNKVFDASAIAAAKASVYQPATQNGKRTEGWCFVKVVYTIQEK
jgi:outer membrane biosynthesis protein TonB